MGSVIVFLVLVLIVFLAARSIYKDKKAGKGSCGGNCSQCHGGCPSGEQGRKRK